MTGALAPGTRVVPSIEITGQPSQFRNRTWTDAPAWADRAAKSNRHTMQRSGRNADHPVGPIRSLLLHSGCGAIAERAASVSEICASGVPAATLINMVRTLDLEGPRPGTREFVRHRHIVTGVLIAAAMASGGLGWALWASLNQVDPTAVPLGAAAAFPPGSVTERVLEVGYFDPVGVESPSSESPPLQEVRQTRLFVVSLPGAGLQALLQRSPFRGCRVTQITQADAAGIVGEVPPDFGGGFYDPCHGGLFSLDGRHLAGPGQRNLDTFPIQYRPDGTVVVDLTELHTASN